MSEQPDFVINFDVPADQVGERLDRVVTNLLPDTSRSFVQRLIEAGNVLVNGDVQRSSYKLALADHIQAHVPPPEAPNEITPADIMIPIVYEDDDVIVFDKPAGLVVHPAPGHSSGTLVNVFKALRPESVQPGTIRPGIVHRLDKDTSGLIVVAKTESARLKLRKQWEAHDVYKEYLALIHGHLDEDEATVDAPIGRDPNNRKRMAVVRGGRAARSHFKVLESLPGYSLLQVQIETGRTHQIRVHCQFIGHPVAQDRTYGGYRQHFPLERQFLHAHRLRFQLPDGRPIELESPLADDLQHALDHLEEQSA